MRIGYCVLGTKRTIYTYNRALAFKVAAKENVKVKIVSDKKVKEMLKKSIDKLKK